MNKSGLTLVEVIISALILALTVGSLLYVFATEKGIVARSGRGIQAMDFAIQTLEELKNEVRADTWEESNQPLTVTSAWGSWENLSGDFYTKFSGRRHYRVDSVDGIDPNTGYRSVTVEVDWQEPSESE